MTNECLPVSKNDASCQVQLNREKLLCHWLVKRKWPLIHRKIANMDAYCFAKCEYRPNIILIVPWMLHF